MDATAAKVPAAAVAYDGARGEACLDFVQAIRRYYLTLTSTLRRDATLLAYTLYRQLINCCKSSSDPYALLESFEVDLQPIIQQCNLGYFPRADLPPNIKTVVLARMTTDQADANQVMS